MGLQMLVMAPFDHQYKWSYNLYRQALLYIQMFLSPYLNFICNIPGSPLASFIGVQTKYFPTAAHPDLS
jgi:hypothetical protein